MYAFRQAELVGKRFLCVKEKNSLRPNSRSSRVSNPLDYQWKVGVIRACSEQDLHHPELKVLVEYDNEDWTTREWLTIYDGSWKIFMVEKTMVWSQRPDPSNPRRPLLWPALTFSPLVDKHGLNEEDRPIPVEFVGDHERVFLRNDEFRPYGQDDDALQPVLRNNPVVMEELRNWQRLQKSQSILLDGPYTLTGFRVKVYRQNCRQWFSAVITAHDLMSRELSCMDDTVLQTHRVNPRLVQVILLANETELDSLLRGELVRVLPIRKHRHSQVIITAPLTTQTTTSSLSSNAPTTWQLYSGLTQASNSNNLVSSTQSAYSSPVVSTVTTRHTAACSPPNPRQSTSTSKERRKSSETRNRSSASRRVTRSDSANSPASSSGTHTQAPQTIQSSLTSSSATPMTSSPRTVSHASSLLSHKTSPPEACTLSPKNSSTLGSMGSPSSSLPKKSPIKQPVSPNTSQPMLQYSSSPISKASMSSMGSPFRSNPFCSSPDMSSVPSMASPMSGMSHMGMCSPGHAGYPRPQSPHPLYSHTMGRLNISPSQLYALQLQQQQQQMQSPEQQEFLTKLQHQHYESLLHQYQMHHYQLQLMLQQQELIQQMPLTLEQQHILAEHYNQLLHQYQCAQIVQQLAAVTQEEQLSMFHPTDERTQVLPEVIQQQLREAQERQKEELQNLMPRLEPEQLQRVFTCLQQRNMTSEQLKQLYTLLIQQQEAHRGPPQEDEEQKQKIQEYLRQNQEHVQKILQLQQSPSFAQDVLHKQEPNQGASSSSSQQESPSSSSLKPSSSSFPPSSSSFPPSTSSFPPSSSSFPPSSSSSSSSSFPPSSSASASSSSSFPPSSSSFPPSSFPPSSSSSFPPSSSAFTVHHLPTPSDSAASTDANSKDKPDSDLHLESSTSEGTKHQASLHADEIELTSTTTEGERSSSPHAILEKLLQHHLQAVEESKHQAPAKTRKARTSSTEKKSKRQRKSAESSSSTRTQTKENSALGKDSQKIKTSALVPDSSTGNPFLSALAGSASRMQEPMDASVIQNFSENEKDSVNKHKLPRNFGVVDSQPSEAESQRKAEVDNTVSSVAGQRYSLVREDSPQKTTPKVPTGDVEKGAPPEGVKLRGSEDTQNEGPSVSANINGSTDMSEGNLQVLGKEKTPTLVKKCSEKVDVVAEEPETSELRSLLEKTSSILPEKETTFSKNVSAEGIIAEKPKKTSSIAPEKEDTKCSKNVSAKGIIAEKPKKTSSIAPEKEDTKRSKNVSAKGIIAEKPKKTSSIAPQKDETKRSKNVSAEGIIAEKPKKTSSIAPQKDETKRSKNVSAKGISAEQPKMSLLDKTCSVALEKEGTNCSENVSAKVIIAKKTKRRILDKTSSTAPDKEDSKCSENVSSNDIISGKPKTTLLDKTSSTAPEKEEINGSENVLAKGVIAEELKTSEFRSMLEKTSSTVPAKEGTETSNSKCNEQEWVELTTLKGVKKPSVNLTVKELSKSPSANLTVRELSKSPSAKLTVKELSKSPSAKLTVKLSKSPSAKLTVQELSKSPQSHLLKNSVHEAAKPSANVSKNQLTHSQDIVSNAMVVDTPVVSQKASLSSEAKTLSTNCFSFLSSNSADHNGELFAELKTYSKRITPKKRKSSSSPKESIVEENSVVSKVLKMESSEVDPKKITVGKKLLESQVEHKPVKRQHQNSLSSGVKGKISRKKLTGENKLQVKKIKCEENNCDNTSADAIQDKPRLELRDQESCVVDSVSFVADQAVKDVTINHSPTMKDAPRGQLDVGQPNFDYLHDRSKERIREMTRKKKKLKAKEEKRKERKNASAVSTTIVKKETVEGESLETVVDSVLDEEIVVIYNGEEHQENRDVNSSEIKKEDVTSEAVIEAVKKPPVKGRKKVESAMKDVVKGRKRKAKKLSDSDGDTVSPNSEQFFLQDRVCAKFSHLPMCRECRDVHGEKTGLEFCRFNLFRRLKKRKNGKVLVAGFQLPEHAANEDFCPWIAQDQVDRMDKMTSLYVLSNVGDQFCSVMQEEKKAITLAGENVSVAYKRAVQGVREMCDVCATTIFNMHWVCHRCGFGVCLDCYNLRVKERNEQPGLAGKRVFEFKWFMCCPGICHQPKYLSVAQIIPKTVLSELGDELHRVREVWDIGKTCPCKSFVSNEGNESGAKITELSNDEMDTTDGKEQRNEPNNSCAGGKEEACEVTVKTETATAPVASCPVNQNLAAMDSESSLEGSDDVNLICDESLGVDSPTNHEQEWLTEEKRRNHFTKKAGFGLVEAKPRQAKGMSSGLSLLMDYTSSTEGSPCDSPANNDVKPKVGAFNFSFSSGLDLLVLACEGKEGLPIPSSVNWDNGSKKEAEKSKPEPQNKQKDSEIRNVSLPVATPSECTSAQCSDEVRQATPMVPDSSVLDSLTDAPHSWLCDGRLLRLHEPRAPGNLKSFAERWKKGEPVLVSHVDKYLNLDIWTPKAFGEEFGSEIADVVNCRNGVVIEKFKVGDFWEGFESIKDRPLDSNDEPMLLKLKDWPPKDDFSEKLPTRFEDLMNNVPLPEYTRRDGSRNLVSRLPEFFVTPDLGPKMYNAYGSAACPKEGTTNLHLDMSDAVNVMVYVGVPKDHGAGEKERKDAIKAVDEACDESQRIRVRQETTRIGALWHIYTAEDADKIRDCLREVAKERKSKHPSHHDPIHDQCFYLDHDIRQRLKKDYGVEGWAICQCLGDAVFIPAGAPHQVRNLYSCIKVAEDFVSPERIDHCFQMTQEFRHLSDKHTNHEDKLQVKNIIYHAVKDALNSLKHHEQELNSNKQHR